MFCATRSYPTGLTSADLATLNNDIRTSLGAEGFTFDGSNFILNGRKNNHGTFYNWNLDASLSMTANDWSYVGGFAGAPKGNNPTMLPITSACDAIVAGDSREGWFWVLLIDSSAQSILSLTAAVNLIPHAVDEDTNALERYGVLFWLPGKPARMTIPGGMRDDGGGMIGELICGTWSPLSGGRRHPANPPYIPASTLPRMIAPLFPNIHDQPAEFNYPYRVISACVPGEIDCVMRATDGYAMGERAAVNWYVYGDAASGYYALRRPEQATAL